MVLGGEMYVYAFVLDSCKVDDINGILNDCPSGFSCSSCWKQLHNVFFLSHDPSIKSVFWLNCKNNIFVRADSYIIGHSLVFGPR